MRKIKLKPILYTKIQQQQSVGIEAEKVVIVKKRFIEVLFDKTGLIIRILANISLFILAFVGLLSLVYPETREGISTIVSEVIAQIGEFF